MERAEEGGAVKTVKRVEAAFRLLKAARNEIQAELDASGHEEVDQNPILNAKARLVKRIDLLLEGEGR